MGDNQARCAHCPVEPGLPCKGIEVRRLCELTDPNHAAYNASYRSLLRQLARGEGLSPASGSSGVTPGLAESLALIRRLSACPHRSARTDCGCAGLARCALGRGQQGLVNHHDCFDCLRAGETR